MSKYHELILSASDAEVLALMLGERRRQHALEAAERSRLSAGTAKHWIALSHYAIVTRDPGGRAA